MNQNTRLQGATTPPAPWFCGSPFTKFYCTVMTISFLASSFHDSRKQFDHAAEANTNYGLSLLTQHLCFESFGEMFIGGYLLIVPLMRRFERELGTRLFCTFLLASTTLSVLYHEMLRSLLSDEDHHNNMVSNGPYNIIGILLYLYHIYTPRLHPKFIGVLGIDFSEKSLTYVLGIMALPLGLLSGLCGIVAAALCSSGPVFPIVSKFQFPEFFYRCSYAVFGPWFVDRRLNAHPVRLIDPSTRMNRRVAAPLQNRNGAGNNQFQNLPPPPPPSEEAIANLTSMGFEREAVIRTLQQCDNNVEVAANRLLSE
eukprot:CAMPEP_0116022370 /NCGR_PEP_ID=MMETSP0321-20121206/10946_1 /TAXON_ID=163516 /ORGANISM="Leptocylindrus danicus var. danicus, Strain B650" /LENGTH=311 /DNA_ID=CAMNT_0003493427 /DNA_START=1 /DNA_END=936 /DNA_ORIENTATION=-